MCRSLVRVNAFCESHIEQSEKLTSIFGRWPDFHDAEVVELHFERGEIRSFCPVLRVKLILWALTSTVDNRGICDFEHQTLTVLEFQSIDEFRMTGFNYQNAILE